MAPAGTSLAALAFQMLPVNFECANLSERCRITSAKASEVLVGGSGGMLPQENFKNRGSKQVL